MIIKMPIGELAAHIEKFKNITLQNNVEVDIQDLSLCVPTPTGFTPLNHFIKKEKLPTKKIIIDNGYSFVAAEKHILQDAKGKDIFVSDLKGGELIKHKNGLSIVTKTYGAGERDCYDVGIASPHVYYDANGVLHHNTILTAVLSQKCESYGRTIVIVPSKDLVKQTEADYINMQLDVGVLYGDRKEYNKTHTICTWQSLNVLLKNTKEGTADIPFSDFIDGVVCVICDEVHQAKAAVLLEMLTGSLGKIPIRWGVTGTIPKEDFEKRSLQVSFGEVIGTIKASDLQEKGVLANCHVHIRQLIDYTEYKNYQDELKYLLETTDRLHYIAGMIQELSKSGNTLVLIDRVEPGKALAAAIPGAIFISGATKSANRKEQYENIETEDGQLLVATFGIAAVGISINRIHNLAIIEPGKSFVRVIQSIGRGLRIGHDKTDVNIYDITSTCKFAKRHLTKRKQFYTEANYPYSIEKIDWQAKPLPKGK